MTPAAFEWDIRLSLKAHDERHTNERGPPIKAGVPALFPVHQWVTSAQSSNGLVTRNL